MVALHFYGCYMKIGKEMLWRKVYTEKIKNHKKAVMISMFLFSILVHGGFFPIVNFNPNHSVDMGMVMRLLIIIMAVTFQKAIVAL